MPFESNETINGLYGYVYDENGTELDSTQEFSAKIDFNKVEIKQPGKFLSGHKVMGGNGTGTVRFLKLDSKLQKKIVDNPTTKYNYMGKLADPTARGEETVLFLGVSFDGSQLLGYTLGEVVEVELNYTFDDFRYVDAIE
jgi:hypothetical protein